MFRAAATRNRSLCTTNFLVGETHALLLARYGRVSALSFLRSVENGTTTIERISSDDERRAIAIIEQNDDKDFSYVDATSFAAMERLAIEEALTFDRHFIQFGFRQASA